MRITRSALFLLCLVLGMMLAPAVAQQRARQVSSVVVDDDGTVHVPAMAVPMSSFLSAEAKAYVTQHLYKATGRIGFIAQESEAQFSQLKFYRMNL